MLPMTPVFRRLLRTTAWRVAGRIALLSRTANFFGRCRGWSAAGSRAHGPGKSLIFNANVRVTGRCSRRCDVPPGAAMERNRPGMEQNAGPLEQVWPELEMSEV